jgi:hypothetical protein
MFALLLLIATCVWGCNLVTPAAYILTGPPTVPARFELEDRPTLVFVDDRGNAMKSNATILRATIAERVSQDLMEQGILTTTISPRDAIAYATSRDRHQKLVAIDDLGRAVGAEQIIYVQMLSFRGNEDGVTPKPTASAQVRVIDVVNRARLFPTEEDQKAAHAVSIELPAIDPGAFRSAANRLKIHRAMADELGDEVGKVFYTHDYKDIGERLEHR